MGSITFRKRENYIAGSRGCFFFFPLENERERVEKNPENFVFFRPSLSLYSKQCAPRRKAPKTITHPSLSKLRICAAKLVGNSLASNRSIAPTADVPASSLS